jgi:hypothetical protein
VQGAQVRVPAGPLPGDLALLQGNLQQAQGLFSLPADGGEAGAVVFVESTAKRTAETQSTQRLC